MSCGEFKVGCDRKGGETRRDARIYEMKVLT